MSQININGKTYNENALKRQVCAVCEKHNYPNLSGFFWRLKFTKEVENLKQFAEYSELKADFFGQYLCHGCFTELVVEYPQVIKKIDRAFP